jgi:predicted RNA binding protein YcfA (HicA-like mRNA interferase family)
MVRKRKASGGAPKLVAVRPDAAIRAFGKIGFVRERTVGSHAILVKPGHVYTLAVPEHATVAPGTLRQLIRAAGITPEEFDALL